jgi:hypothetical protein
MVMVLGTQPDGMRMMRWSTCCIGGFRVGMLRMMDMMRRRSGAEQMWLVVLYAVVRLGSPIRRRPFILFL